MLTLDMARRHEHPYMMLNPLPYITLDASVLQNESILIDASRQCAANGWELLLPEIALTDLSLGRRPEETWRRAFSLLAAQQCPIRIGMASGQLFQYEIDHGQPYPDVVDWDGMPIFSALLEAYRSGDAAAQHDAVNAVVESLRRERNAEGPDCWKPATLEQLDAFRNRLSSPLAKRLRSGDFNAIVEILSRPTTLEQVTPMVRATLDLDGGKTVDASMLVKSESRIAHYAYLRLTYDLYWFGAGGAQSRSEVKFENDSRDLEYALIGMQTRKLLTEDKLLRDVWQWNMQALDRRRAQQAGPRRG